MVKVSVIILNYNGGDYLLNCVESVVKNSFLEIEIILVDNASSDQSHKKCKEKYPQIILFENEKNIGMAGRNVGFRNDI